MIVAPPVCLTYPCKSEGTNFIVPPFPLWCQLWLAGVPLVNLAFWLAAVKSLALPVNPKHQQILSKAHLATIFNTTWVWLSVYQTTQLLSRGIQMTLLATLCHTFQPEISIARDLQFWFNLTWVASCCHHVWTRLFSETFLKSKPFLESEKRLCFSFGRRTADLPSFIFAC